jgi:hypothetical protein
MRTLIDAYCKRQGLQASSVRFLFNGEPLTAEDTADKQEMQDGDAIDVIREVVQQPTFAELRAVGKVDVNGQLSADAFRDDTTLTKVVLPNGVTSMEESDEYAGPFSGCTSLQEIRMPNTLTSISVWAFWGCSSLEVVAMSEVVPWTPTRHSTFPNSFKRTVFTFMCCFARTNILPDNMLFKIVWLLQFKRSAFALGGGAFCGCRKLKEIALPDTLTVLGDSAFSGCSSLEEIALPDTLAAIGDRAFYKCTSLREVTFSATLTAIGRDAFEKCTSIQAIRMPDTLSSISQAAFLGCSSLREMTLPTAVVLGKHTFLACHSLEVLALPARVSIGEGAFGCCNGLREVVFPPSLMFMAPDAFADCPNLQTVLPTMPVWAPSLAELQTAGKVDEHGQLHNDAFKNEKTITRVILPEGLTSIQNGVDALISTGAFMGCTNLTEITLPSTLTFLGRDAFSGCSSLEEIVLPVTLAALGDGAFMDCSSLRAVRLPAGLTALGNHTFSGCCSLIEIALPNTLVTIGICSFNECYELREVVFPDALTDIGAEACMSCYNLEKVTLYGAWF